MFFLLRLAFWLGIVCVLLPSGGSNSTSPSASIDTAQAVSAAGATLGDMRHFCDRQPQACEVGGQAAVAIGQKAQAGAKVLYEFISEKLAKNNSSQGRTGQKLEPVSAPGTQNTLTPSDLAPVWHGPVPLPPRREALNRRPAA